MIKANGWVRNCEIDATSLLCGLRINVWLECPGMGHTLTVFDTEDSTGIVNLLLRNNHFQLLHEIPMFHQATSDIYAQPEYDSGTNNPKDLPPAFHDHTCGLQHGFNLSRLLIAQI